METTELGQAIKSVDKETVHRICSGQVVLDLTTAVKELVENSIDAGATNIEVRLKENGTQLVEVIDNGHGVREIDFQGLTTKHATSKLSMFSDLFSVSTFGFRGEALSSLCALADVSISTRHVSADVGTTMDFDHNGILVSKKILARSVGTTVSIKDLFGTMPVRRREFLRNSRREFNKMVHILQAYCLISNGVRISCNDVGSKGKRVSVLSTNGNGSLRENVVDVFGPKQIQNLEEIRWEMDRLLTEEHLEHFNIRTRPEAAPRFRISGFVSSCVHGRGRNSNDRQFYFVNGRPCEPNKLSKVVNETYRLFNRHQNPFVCLNIETNREEVDVNITPDKRQVLFENEKFLLATVRSALLEIYEKIPATYEVQTPTAVFATTSTENTENLFENKIENKIENLNLSVSFSALRSSFTAEGSSLSSNNFSSKRRKVETSKTDSTLTKYFSVQTIDQSAKKEVDESQESPNFKSFEQFSETKSSLQEDECKPKLKISFFEDFRNSNFENSTKSESDEDMSQSSAKVFELQKSEIDQQDRVEEQIEKEVRIWDEKVFDKKNRKTKEIEFSFEQLRRQTTLGKSETKNTESNFRRFLAKISPTENETAEDELRKEFCREDFRKMKIFGQFNLGFIIAGKEEDLFIIDQHATDEKYNFERLQNARDTEIQTQRLVVRQSLELTSTNEDILIENVETFRDNGFEFEIDPDAAPTKRVFLTQIPHSKNWTFGKQDVEELIFMLSEQTGDASRKAVYRPSRVRAMFASRACRTSVMIGTSLGKTQMKNLVDHMADMENPWSCPHGRPTMRHLINLKMIHD